MITRRSRGVYACCSKLLPFNSACFTTAKVCAPTMATPSTQHASHTTCLNECAKSEPTCRPPQADHVHNEDYFNYTRGRFVSNEQHEMSQRYVRFHVPELARLAAEAVGSKSCVGIEKYPDGMYNKALLLTMDDGTQAVAKVPNPNAGRPHFTTASEVATMEFVSLAESEREFEVTMLKFHSSGRN